MNRSYWWETYRRDVEAQRQGNGSDRYGAFRSRSLPHSTCRSSAPVLLPGVLLILSFVPTLGLEGTSGLVALPTGSAAVTRNGLLFSWATPQHRFIAIKASVLREPFCCSSLTTAIVCVPQPRLPMLPALLCIYQPLNKKSLPLESTINKIREDELNAALAKDNVFYQGTTEKPKGSRLPPTTLYFRRPVIHLLNDIKSARCPIYRRCAHRANF